MIRSSLALSFAALLAVGSSASAQATRQPSFGQQLQQQAVNNLQNRVLGQPAYPNQGYGPNQGYNPYQNPGYNQAGGPYRGNTPYQVQRPVYGQNGYQPSYGQPGYQPGFGQPGYRQPGFEQPAQRYQLPAQYGGYAPGSQVNYGGATYVVNQDRTMSPANVAQPAAPAQRYQIPAQFAGTAPGSTVTYGSANYAINADGTMSPVR